MTISFVSNVTAGKTTTDEELEEMLDGGNAAVFTAGVCVFPKCHSIILLVYLLFTFLYSWAYIRVELLAVD